MILGKIWVLKVQVGIIGVIEGYTQKTLEILIYESSIRKDG